MPPVVDDFASGPTAPARLNGTDNAADFLLGDCRVEPAAHQLCFADGETLSLQPKVLEVLLMLARCHPQVVSRDQLIDEVWKGNALVGQNALTNAIWHLRQAFGRRDSTRDCILTVRKSGYRLTLTPTPVQAAAQMPVQAAGLSLSSATFPVSSPQTGAHAGQVTAGVAAPLSAPARPSGWWILALALLASALIPGIAFWAQRNDAPPGLRSERLTRDPGRELAPQVSPDGKRLAYLAVAADGRRDIRIKDLAHPDTPDVIVTREDEREHLPIWDADGRHLLFGLISPEAPHCRVVRLDPQTRERQTLWTCDKLPPRQLALSPDGERLAYIDERRVRIADRRAPESAVRTLACAAPCPEDYTDTMVAFAPDGRSVVVLRALSNLVADLHRVDLDSGKTQRLTTGFSGIRGFSWHHGGRYLVFSAQESGRRDGYLLDLQSGRYRPLGLDGMSAPAFVPGRSSLVYNDWALHHYIAEIDLAGLDLGGKDSAGMNSASPHRATPSADKPQRAAEPAGSPAAGREEAEEGAGRLSPMLGGPLPLLKSTFNLRSAHYSPVAHRYAFVSNETGRDELWWAARDGSGRERLTDLPRPVSFPRWSHDGRMIAFLTQDAELSGDALYVLHLDGRRLMRVPLALHHLRRPTWTRDDQHLIVAAERDGKPDLYRVDLRTGTHERMTDDGAFMGQQLADGRIVYSRFELDGLWQRDADFSGARPFSDPRCNSKYNWVVSDVGAFCEYNHPGGHSILFQSAEQAHLKELNRLARGMIAETGSFDYNTEDRKLVITMDEFTQADILRVEHPDIR